MYGVCSHRSEEVPLFLSVKFAILNISIAVSCKGRQRIAERRTHMKRMLSVLLAVIMIMTLLPLQIFAAESAGAALE